MARPKESSPATTAGAPAVAPGTRVACVLSTYHLDVVGRMAASARATLEAAGLDPAHLVEVHAPGAFELPLVAQRLARRADVDAVLAFGLVLKGETEHDRYIAASVADGLQRVALENDKPVLFGLLTCPTLEHAVRRATPEAEGGLDKGREVALAALRALATLRELEGTS